MRSKSCCAFARRVAMPPRAPARAASRRPPARMIQGRAAPAPSPIRCGMTTANRWPATVNSSPNGLPAAACSRRTVGGREPQPPGLLAAARRVASDRKTATAPGRSTPSIRFGTAATRKRPRVPPLRPAIGVAPTPPSRIARRSAAGIPADAAQIDAARVHGRKTGDQRRRQVGRARAGHRSWRSVGCRDGLARCVARMPRDRESATRSTHAAAGKPPG